MFNSTPNERSNILGLLLRFGLAGAVNTGVGFTIIEALDLGFRVPPAIANACGYAVGLCLGFVLNRGFVFRRSGRGVLLRYLVAIAFAFSLNQTVLAGLRLVMGDAPISRTLAQLAGMATYTAVTFVLCRFWVFAAANTTTDRSRDATTPI